MHDVEMIIKNMEDILYSIKTNNFEVGYRIPTYMFDELYDIFQDLSRCAKNSVMYFNELERMKRLIE